MSFFDSPWDLVPVLHIKWARVLPAFVFLFLRPAPEDGVVETRRRMEIGCGLASVTMDTRLITRSDSSSFRDCPDNLRIRRRTRLEVRRYHLDHLRYLLPANWPGRETQLCGLDVSRCLERKVSFHS